MLHIEWIDDLSLTLPKWEFCALGRIITVEIRSDENIILIKIDMVGPIVYPVISSRMQYSLILDNRS